MLAVQAPSPLPECLLPPASPHPHKPSPAPHPALGILVPSLRRKAAWPTRVGAYLGRPAQA